MAEPDTAFNAPSAKRTPPSASARTTGDTSRREFGRWPDLLDAARASARYHSVAKARADGFEPFFIPEDVGGTPLTIDGDEITCFDSDDAGMGVHYVRNVDEQLDPADPEALVYEVGVDGRLTLVALEYIVPEDDFDPADPRELFGQTMHHHAYLPVYILHVWIWKSNPDGLFADFNPLVPACPTDGSF